MKKTIEMGTEHNAEVRSNSRRELIPMGINHEFLIRETTLKNANGDESRIKSWINYVGPSVENLVLPCRIDNLQLLGVMTSFDVAIKKLQKSVRFLTIPVEPMMGNMKRICMSTGFRGMLHMGLEKEVFFQNVERVTFCVDPSFHGDLFIDDTSITNCPVLKEIDIVCSNKCSLSVRKITRDSTYKRPIKIRGTFSKIKLNAAFDYRIDAPNCSLESFEPQYFAIRQFMENTEAYSSDEVQHYLDYMKKHERHLFCLSDKYSEAELFRRELAVKQLARFPQFVPSPLVCKNLIEYYQKEKEVDMVATFTDVLHKNYDVEKLNESAYRKEINKMMNPDSVAALSDVWKWKKKPDGSIKITLYKGGVERKEIVFPEKIGRASVTEIGPNIFALCKRAGKNKVRSIVVPDTVQIIHEAAFRALHERDYVYKNNESTFKISSVRLPANLKYIPDNLLSDMYHLTDVNIPESVLGIGNCAFKGVPANISIPRSVEYIGHGAFESCCGLRIVELDNCKCEDTAFYKAGVVRMTFHNRVLNNCTCGRSWSDSISQDPLPTVEELPLHVYAPDAELIFCGTTENNIVKQGMKKTAVYVHVSSSIIHLGLGRENYTVVVPDEETRERVRWMTGGNTQVVLEEEL